MSCVLGLDVGTTAVKAVLLADDGSVGEVASAQYALSAREGGRFEQDPEELFDALARAARAAARGKKVRGIGLSTQAAALLILGPDGRPRGPVISWMDQRAGAEADEMLGRLGNEFFGKRTGLDGPGITAPLLAWLERNDPGILRAAQVSFVEDWLARTLTGRGGSDPTNASITGLLNLDALDWDSDILAELGLVADAFPPMKRAGEVLGELLPAAAERLGLSPVPVAAAAHDQYAAALGAGVIDPAQAMLSTGTAWVILGLAARVERERSRGFFLAPHPASGAWGAMGATPAGNGYFDRTLKMLGLDYSLAESEARQSTVGARGLCFLPCPGGTREAAWVGWRLDHGRGDAVRAVMEGLAVEASFLLDSIGQVAGRAREVAVLGGASKNRLWIEILASVLDIPVVVPAIRDAAAVGAAVLGGVAAGWWRDAREGRKKVVLPMEHVGPVTASCGELRERYAELREKFTG